MDNAALAVSEADNVSVVLALILITMTPLWVPRLMASNAPFRVVKLPVAVPDVAVRVTCAMPAIEQNSKRNRNNALTVELLRCIHVRFRKVLDCLYIRASDRMFNSMRNGTLG